MGDFGGALAERAPELEGLTLDRIPDDGVVHDGILTIKCGACEAASALENSAIELAPMTSVRTAGLASGNCSAAAWSETPYRPQAASNWLTLCMNSGGATAYW